MSNQLFGLSEEEYAILKPASMARFTNSKGALFADLKHLFKKEDIEAQGLTYWTL